MRTTSRSLALIAVGAALALAACAGSPDGSPLGPTTMGSSTGTVTASGNGPGGPADTPGSGTCTNECDGTGQGPGPGNGNGQGPGNGNGQGPGNGPGDGLCGNACDGPVGPDPADIAALLELALQEEYKALMLYRSVLEDYAGARPFALVADSEARHAEALQLLFTRRELPAPPSAWTPESFPAFPSLPLACAAGVDAERTDAAFYTPYLDRSDLPQDVRNVFTNLQAASLESHLPAFERCR